MAQALCWLVARLSGLAGVIADPGGEVWLLPARGRVPSAPRWLPRLLRVARILKPGESPRPAAELTPAGRLRLAARGVTRAEFERGADARFRALVIREAADFAALTTRAIAAA